MSIVPAAVRMNAVLTALKDDPSWDVIDALCYFYVPILDKVKGSPVTASFLAKAAKIVYGWSITESIGQVFLDRLTAHGYVKEEVSNGSKHYIAQASPELSQNLGETAREAFEKITSLFKSFDLVESDLIYRTYTEEQLGDMLVSFLISLDAYSNDEISAEIRLIAADSQKGNGLVKAKLKPKILKRDEAFICARFIQSLHGNEPDLAAKLSLFVAAGLLAELVEDFRKPTIVETKSATIFFLDGPMLLALLGTNGIALQEEAKAVLGALSSIGCSIQVFSESCREAERVLSGYLKAVPSDRHGKTHSAVLSGETSPEYVKAVASDIERAAEKYGIGVRDYKLDAFPNEHKFFNADRNADIYSFLAWENPLARDHDAFAVTAVMRMRQGKHRNDPLKVSHVFISSNERLVKKSRDYCIKSGLINDNQCGPVVDIRDVATIAWLRTGFLESKKIPTSHMLAQCERVLQVRKDVIDAAKIQVSKFSPDRREQFELLLQDNRAVNYLMDASRGSAIAFEENHDQHLLDGMLSAAIRVVTDEKDQQISDKDRHIANLKIENNRAEALLKRKHELELAAKFRETELLSHKVDNLEAERNRDRLALALVEETRDEIVQRGATIINRRMFYIRVGTTVVLCILGASAAITVRTTNVPNFIAISSQILSLIGIGYTVFGMSGKSVPGFSQIYAKASRRLFLGFCRDRGVSDEAASERFVLEDGRIRIVRRKPASIAEPTDRGDE